MRHLAGICPLESIQSHLHILPEGPGRLWLDLYTIQVQHAWTSISFPPVLTNGEKKHAFIYCPWLKGETDYNLGICACDISWRER